MDIKQKRWKRHIKRFWMSVNNINLAAFYWTVFCRKLKHEPHHQQQHQQQRHQLPRNSIHRYSNKCEWLTNETFLKDLEDDSVDADILDEELRLIHEQQPKTTKNIDNTIKRFKKHKFNVDLSRGNINNKDI
ncbi:hypothetical protein HELRODRAFT_174437 [Helobdella robusta]|uniref:Uncharacterized protein n=1 Tax=Helobdella robusta TaxID=6412 RepID=T1F846_HELRO|nr:hypothetical protein HELRODRAFT_174437 [Helobdella robusta]ESO01489.1 hypothetical protein HELRODRAFT_174437 [Helobdella robusta]